MDNKEIRRANLKALKNLHRSYEALSELTGVAASYLSQCGTGYRGMGDNAARKIEAGLGKPKGWLDALISSEAPQPEKRSNFMSGLEAQFLSMFASLSPEEQGTAFGWLAKLYYSKQRPTEDVFEPIPGAVTLKQPIRVHEPTDPERPSQAGRIHSPSPRTTPK